MLFVLIYSVINQANSIIQIKFSNLKLPHILPDYIQFKVEFMVFLNCQFNVFLINSLYYFITFLTQEEIFMNSQTSQEQQSQYINYLEAQVDKFSAFMITQKNLNDRHIQFERTLNHVLKKIEKNEQKIALIEIYQNDNLFQCKKMSKQRENIKLLEMRFDSLQNQLKLIYKKALTNQTKKISQQQKQITPKSGSTQYKQFQNPQRLSCSQKEGNNNAASQNRLYSQDEIVGTQSQMSVQMNNQALYELHKMDQQEVYRYIEQMRQDFQVKVKKIEIQTQRNKQTILKLSNHLNNLSSVSKTNLQKFKRESRALIPKMNSQSTKQITSTQPNQNSQTVTKKQIKKMQRRLHSLFTQKIQQISDNFRRKNSQKQSETKRRKNQQRISLKKYKFKALQDEFQKGVGIKTSRNHSQPEGYCQNQNQKYLKRKKSIFKNDLLKNKNLDNSDKKQNNSKKKINKKQKLEDKQQLSAKSRQKRQHLISKQKRKKSKDKQTKSIKTKKNQRKLNEINDYMIY